MPSFRDLLADGRVHVFDGAMGTMLYGKGVFLNVCYDELALRQPDLVREIHREYVKAGAELLETNTFGANPFKLAHYGLAAETERINAAAGRVAREAAGGRAVVLGAIGPLGVFSSRCCPNAPVDRSPTNSGEGSCATMPISTTASGPTGMAQSSVADRTACCASGTTNSSKETSG